MSKRAEEAALKTYPELLSGSYFGPLPVDLNKVCREKYQEGYEQAEKNLALTWEDIEKITDIHRNVLYDNPKRIMGAKENYEDTLRKFNKWREKNRATKKIINKIKNGDN